MSHSAKRCPFLREAQVKSCHASGIRKQIVRDADAPHEELCTSTRYTSCPLVKECHEERSAHSRCPFLHESLVQYCAATPVTKYIPYSESLITRCGTRNHQYCPVFVSHAKPARVSSDSHDAELRNADDGDLMVEGIPVSSSLQYTPNHMWIDLEPDGDIHIGLDAFASHVLGAIEGVSYLPNTSGGRPAALVSTRGIDLPIVSPVDLRIFSTNTTVRAHPEYLAHHPYTLGWLFEGTMSRKEHSSAGNGGAGFIEGEEIVPWIKSEVSKLTTIVHDHLLPRHPDFLGAMADGGSLSPDMTRHLDREEVLFLYNEFFSPSRHREKTE
ncbi:MAG: glycine cleavage system protein H [Ignavibacteria bacterium]|nr:glycine cleavage system protein H [Ignavibacteria bacterium]